MKSSNVIRVLPFLACSLNVLLLKFVEIMHLSIDQAWGLEEAIRRILMNEASIWNVARILNAGHLPIVGKLTVPGWCIAQFCDPQMGSYLPGGAVAGGTVGRCFFVFVHFPDWIFVKTNLNH